MNYIPYVNVKMGADSWRRFSSGSTLPLTQLPWAMAGFMPQTVSDYGWFFQPYHRSVEGIRLTHQPSPWIRDYGTFLMTPQADIRFDDPARGWSGYRREDAIYRPDLLKICFLRQRCDFSLAPTPRGAAIRLHYDLLENIGLTFYPLLGDNKWRFDEKTNTLFGWTNGHSVDKTDHFRMYIAVRFEEGDVDATASCVFDCGELGEGYHVMFNKADITAKLAISYLSEEQALYNLDEDLGGKSFDEVQKVAEDIWEEYLHRIEIESDDEEQLKTFYSCLYRTALYPHMTYEHDRETGENVYLCPFDGEKKQGVRYTDNGFWDTYRTVYPLYAFIARDKYAEMLEAFVNDYRDGGWLPRWPSFGEVGAMPSTLIDATIADAVVKGIGSPEVWQTALEGMIKHANHSSGVNHFGRNGVEEYCKYGYVPYDVCRESVNLTLDAAYGDYCIARVAQALGCDAELIEKYDRRSKNYCNLFDAKTGFMRARHTNGSMREGFDPLCWGGDYTEGCAWQNSFAVPHDVQGLADLYGGKENFIAKLDELFATKPEYRMGVYTDGYRNEIHEMSELAAVDFGQCAISNQPSFHIPFLYSMLGEEAKSSAWVKKLCTAFSAADDGYPGDEDNGSMSAWYIFAQLGVYPVCPGMPGTTGYAKTDMLVKGAKILGKAWDPEKLEQFI